MNIRAQQIAKGDIIKLSDLDFEFTITERGPVIGWNAFYIKGFDEKNDKHLFGEIPYDSDKTYEKIN